MKQDPIQARSHGEHLGGSGPQILFPEEFVLNI